MSLFSFCIARSLRLSPLRLIEALDEVSIKLVEQLFNGIHLWSITLGVHEPKIAKCLPALMPEQLDLFDAQQNYVYSSMILDNYPRILEDKVILSLSRYNPIGNTTLLSSLGLGKILLLLLKQFKAFLSGTFSAICRVQ